MALEVTIDGVKLPDEEARAFWQRFSAHMEANKGDLGGFAKSEGLASVVPETGRGGALLRCSRTAPQPGYFNAAKVK
jgi:hypothetical protein